MHVARTTAKRELRGRDVTAGWGVILILHGRLTVYGEYLMHDTGQGLIVPSRLVLATPDEVRVPWHADYDPLKDGVASILRAWGFSVHARIRGDMPLGCGLASSSMLAALHAGTQLLARTRDIMNTVDAIIHGFEPSGLDASFCLRQRAGLFLSGRWTDISVSLMRCSLVLPTKEGAMNLAEVREHVLRRRQRLAGLAWEMSVEVLKTGRLPYEQMMAYCRTLAKCGVYSEQAQACIEHLSANEIAAKGIGGLYDKAVLIIWPPGVASEAVPEVLSRCRSFANMPLLDVL